MSFLVRCVAFALLGAGLYSSSSSCLIYNEDLLVEGDGGSGGTGGVSSGGAGGSAGCMGVCTHLLISEIVVQPNSGELVEIHNPHTEAMPLDDVYLADFAEYYTIASGTPAPGSTDFVVRFPSGSTIEAGGRMVVAFDTAANFLGQYGQQPDFELESMPGTVTSTSGLANGDEMLILFQWDGVSAQVVDLDYVVWGNTTDGADKTGVPGYANDTPKDQQAVISPPQSAAHRCNDDEPGETEMGGNGLLGHDEMSEDLPSAFAEGSPSPGASPPAGVCP